MWRQQQKSVRKAVHVKLDLLQFRCNSQIVWGCAAELKWSVVLVWQLRVQ